MGLTNNLPADVLRLEIKALNDSLPIFLRPKVSPVLAYLDVWIQSVEARLRALDKMPSAQAIAMLNAAPPITEDEAAKEHRRAALAARGQCEDCEE